MTNWEDEFDKEFVLNDESLGQLICNQSAEEIKYFIQQTIDRAVENEAIEGQKDMERAVAEREKLVWDVLLTHKLIDVEKMKKLKL